MNYGSDRARRSTSRASTGCTGSAAARRRGAFNEIKDSQIAERIAGELGLTPQVQDTGIVHPYLLQNNLSDIDFLLMRARRIRYEVLIAGSKLVFREAANNLGETLSLEYQKDLKWFQPRLSTADLAGEITVRGWNPATKEAILGVGTSGDETSLMGGKQVGPALVDAASARPPKWSSKSRSPRRPRRTRWRRLCSTKWRSA